MTTWFGGIGWSPNLESFWRPLLDCRSPQQERRSPRRMETVTVLQTLQAALNEGPPPSVRQVIQRTNHDKPMIYRYFPELCRAIARRFADYRKVQAVVRRDRARVEVIKAAYQLHARGVRITRKHLRPLLTSS